MFNCLMLKTSRRSMPLNFEVVIIICGVFLTVLAPRWWLVDAGSDDLLYVRQALSFKAGDWLGGFADGGGLKLPGFQIFLAIFSITQLPFYLGVFAIQVFGAFLVRDYFKKCFQGNYHKTVFAFCVLTPAMYGANNSRLLRDGFYSALLIVLVGVSLRLFLQIKNSVDLKLKNFFWPLISFATVSTWLAFTREETVAFILFDLVLVGSTALIPSWNRRGFLTALKFILICLFFFGIADYAIKSLNEKYYKTSSASFIQSGPLVDLVNQWSLVQPVDSNPRILISSAQREVIYSKIPVIGLKKDNLEEYLGWYAGASCGQAQVCDDIGSGWTFWAIFYGLTMGEARSTPEEFNKEVRLMTEEIKTFCELDPVNCDRSIRIPTIGSPRNILPILSTVPFDLFNSFAQVGNNDPIPPSSGNAGNAEIFRELTPIGGPPSSWSTEPIGYGTTTNLAVLLCILLLLGNTRNIVAQSKKGSHTKEMLAPLVFIGILILFRTSVTSVISVVGWDVIRTNYTLPSNVISWIFLSQIPLLVTIFHNRRDQCETPIVKNRKGSPDK
jgi:hypothetical protein